MVSIYEDHTSSQSTIAYPHNEPHHGVPSGFCLPQKGSLDPSLLPAHAPRIALLLLHQEMKEPNTALLGFEGSGTVAEEHVFDFCFFCAGEGVSSSMTPEGGGRKDLKTACSFSIWVGAAWPNPSSSICRWQSLYQHPLGRGKIDRQGGHGRYCSRVDSCEFAQCFCSESMKSQNLSQESKVEE